MFANCRLRARFVAYSDDYQASLELTVAGPGAPLVPELAQSHCPKGVVVLDVLDIRLTRNIFALLINDK